MKSIDTLIPDIQRFLKENDGTGWFTGDVAKTYAKEVTLQLERAFGARKGVPRLRLSQMGPKCPCHLWHSIHSPFLAEPLSPSAVVKFTFGHQIEAMAITWARACNHEVTGEQDELRLDGIVGHRDCIIDGCLVDVKSTSTLSFSKFKDKTLAQSDSFGYLDQLDGYLAASIDDPLLRVKDRGYILAIDKQLGHMCLYEHEHRPGLIEERIRLYKSIIERSEPPACTCGTVPDGQAGNIKLDVVASYSPFKHACFPRLRTFLYADGPRYLTVVKRRPQRRDGSYITEVDKHGNVVYN